MIVSAGLDATAVKKLVLDTFFPVGSTYISADSNFDPSTSWGGTWTKIQNKFLLASGTRNVGNNGGEESVTLTTNQIPSHSHGIGSVTSTGQFTATACWNGDNESGSFTSTSKGNGAGGGASNGKTYRYSFYTTSSGSVSSAGGGGSHNNMPPYEVVNIWKRTA